MHLVSWNVNGIRAIIKKNFIYDIKTIDPDILCLQETKGQPEDVKIALKSFSEYNIYINSSKSKKGYSGTTVLTKEEPIEVTYDLGIEEHDQEGRLITAEFEKFFLITVYTPNSGEGMKRLAYRKTWDQAFANHARNLEGKKPVVICGDLNVAHTEIDLARPKPNYNKTSGYTQAEIDGLEHLLSVGYFDSFRHFYPEAIKYSWWNYKFNARSRNAGWRIDYFLISNQLTEQTKGADIYNDIMGSDHCPVALKLEL